MISQRAVGTCPGANQKQTADIRLWRLLRSAATTHSFLKRHRGVGVRYVTPCFRTDLSILRLITNLSRVSHRFLNSFGDVTDASSERYRQDHRINFYQRCLVYFAELRFLCLTIGSPSPLLWISHDRVWDRLTIWQHGGSQQSCRIHGQVTEHFVLLMQFNSPTSNSHRHTRMHRAPSFFVSDVFLHHS